MAEDLQLLLVCTEVRDLESFKDHQQNVEIYSKTYWQAVQRLRQEGCAYVSWFWLKAWQQSSVQSGDHQ